MSKLSVIILAGGSGTRMMSNLPKVLHPLAGKALLDHVIDAVLPLNPDEIFVVYGHKGEMVLEAMAQRNHQVTWIEQKERLGTGHAVLQVLPHLEEDRKVLILCGDVPLISTDTLRHLLEATHENQLGILTADVPRPFGLGRIIRDEYMKVLGIVEEKDATDIQKQITEINTGIYCVPAKLLQKWLPKLSNNNAQKEYYLTEIVSFAGKEQVAVNAARPKKIEEIYGVNTRVELSILERIYQKWQCETLMLQGVTMADPARVEIRGKITPAKDCFIDIGVILKGNVILAENCSIGAHSILENVSLSEGVTIHPQSVIQDAEIGEGCVIGPFARIRPHTKLAKNVHIGNFVELKNATIDEGSKANHLTYLGDTQIGKKVNVGAGVITCNYDGANKHQTIIEDDVFVGSDVQLIAPITVEKGATIGAGTTLAKDAPAGKLTVARAKQITIDGWERPKKKQ